MLRTETCQITGERDLSAIFKKCVEIARAKAFFRVSTSGRDPRVATTHSRRASTLYAKHLLGGFHAGVSRPDCRRKTGRDDQAMPNRPPTRLPAAKKRNEVLMCRRRWRCRRTRPGLDIDALRVVANGVNALRTKEHAMIVITHYQRLLNYIIPDFIHVLHEGRIVKSGTKELALELESKGYDWLKSESVPAH
jgi:hypothetical protein